MKLIQDELDFLEKFGSDRDILKEVEAEVSCNIKSSAEDVDISFNRISTNIQIATFEFLNTQNEYNIPLTNGISATVYIPNYENNTKVKLSFIASGRSRVNDKTLFDIASITKIYTLLLAYRLEGLGFFSFQDKISDLNPHFSNLEDFTINDLVMLHGEMRTLGNLAEIVDEEEAKKVLHTLYLTNKDRNRNKYTDFGAITLAETMVYVVNQKNGKNYTYEELVNEYLLLPLNIGSTETTYNPVSHNILGNGDNTNLVHDPKTRALGNVSGAAGLYANGYGLIKLADRMFTMKNNCDYSKDICSKPQIFDMGVHTYPNSEEPHKGKFGIYLKHPQGGSSFAPKAYSNLVFAHQGFTGSLAIFDPIYNIHNSILVDAITKEKDKYGYGKNQKPVDFMDAFDKYEDIITKYSLIAMLVKKYYENKNKREISVEKIYTLG